MPKIDKSQLKFGVPHRVRSDKHKRFINSLSCAVCHAPPPSECAHISAAGGKGMGLKVSDEYTIPLCHTCHHTAHQIGERSFFGDVKSVSAIAQSVYEVSGDREMALRLLRGIICG